MPVSAVFENLEAGATIEEIIEQFDITREQINAVLEFAARSLDPNACSLLHIRLWMLILFDHVTPRGIARFLADHTVTKAKDRGWDTLTNGDLLAEAERAGFDVLLTADKNMRYQQNLKGRSIALVVLSTPQWPAVRLHYSEDRCCGERRNNAGQLCRSRDPLHSVMAPITKCQPTRRDTSDEGPKSGPAQLPAPRIPSEQLSAPRDILRISIRPHPGERFHNVRTFKMGDHQAQKGRSGRQARKSLSRASSKK